MKGAAEQSKISFPKTPLSGRPQVIDSPSRHKALSAFLKVMFLESPTVACLKRRGRSWVSTDEKMQHCVR